jgi:hypothetical protein
MRRLTTATDWVARPRAGGTCRLATTPFVGVVGCPTRSDRRSHFNQLKVYQDSVRYAPLFGKPQRDDSSDVTHVTRVTHGFV